MRTLFRVLIAAAAAICTVFVLSGPASAHGQIVKINDGGIVLYGYVEVGSTHHVIKVCDQRYDNIGVYVEYYMSNGRGEVYETLSDTNGAASPCGEATLPYGYNVTRFNGHARDGHSTGWRVP
jgi:hypothetical protein